MARIQTHDQSLLEAAKEGDNAKVRSLLQGGVPVETVDEYKRTALMLAAQAGNAQTIQVLLDFGANIDARNELGATPLMLASLNGKVDVVRLLAEDGANVNAQSQNGLTPFMLAVVKRESSVQEGSGLSWLTFGSHQTYTSRHHASQTKDRGDGQVQSARSGP